VRSTLLSCSSARFLGVSRGLLGARRVLLGLRGCLTLISLLLPFASSFPVLLVLLVLAGLTAGTFLPSDSFVHSAQPPHALCAAGIAMYAMDIVFTTNVATSLEAWYIDHWSWALDLLEQRRGLDACHDDPDLFRHSVAAMPTRRRASQNRTGEDFSTSAWTLAALHRFSIKVNDCTG